MTRPRSTAARPTAAPRRGLAWRLPRLLGSLEMAVCLLPLLAAVLFLGTLVESWYERSVAQDLVYGTWWFALLLVLLGTNIFFAAVKKWPWKRHQTGFLITHVGLITLVVAGLLSSLTGLTGVMSLVDSTAASGRARAANTGSEAVDGQSLVLRVARVERGASDFFEAPLAPGPSAWQPTADAIAPDGLTRFLLWLAHPLPREWRHDLDASTRVEVLDFQPHTRRELFAADGLDGASDKTTFPALELELTSPATGSLPRTWVAALKGADESRFGPGRVEFAGRGLTPDKLAEFLQATKAKRGDRRTLGLLQFATGDDGRLYFRAFSAPEAAAENFALDRAGPCSEMGPSEAIWPAMRWRFRVTRFLPAAIDETAFIPVARTLGQQDPATMPAVRVRLTHAGDSREIWLGRREQEYRSLVVGGEKFGLGLFSQSYELPFQLTLLRAEQTTDRGSQMPATQSSVVLLNDDDQGLHDAPHTIALNEPLIYRGYRVYQAGHEVVGRDREGRPIHRSVLRVTLDPGLRLKYVGSLLVAGGIACMFYMRAYRLTGKPAAKPSASAPPADVLAGAAR